MSDAKLADYSEIVAKIVMSQYPLLPHREWGQDSAYLAYCIDGWIKEIGELRSAVDDLWTCIAQPEIDELQPETAAKGKAIHNMLWQQSLGGG